MNPKKVISATRRKKRSEIWRGLLVPVGIHKFLAAFLTVGVVVSLLPFVTVNSPRIAQADMLSVLKRAFNGYTTSQNPSNNTPPTPPTGPPPPNTCPAGQIILGMDNSVTPPKPKCGPPSALTNPGNHTWLCPAGQVESGLTGREEGAPVRCVPCPPGTVRMFVAGGEACHTPNWVPDYSNVPPGYQVGANGEICRADGQSYAGSFHPRYRYTYPGYGECCNGGARADTVVSGSSVAVFVCGAPGSPKCGYDFLPGTTSCPNGPPQPNTPSTPTPPPTATPPDPATCPAGQIILGTDNSTKPPTIKCGPPSALTNPTNHTWLCPAGQVESGIEYHRDAPSPIRCVPCPPGTVRMFVAGGESCHAPNWTPDYSNIPPGYEIGANGQICLADGQSYAGAHNPRYKLTYPNFGACCNGGHRADNPVVAGSSVYLFICGPGGFTGDSGRGLGAGPQFRVSGVFESASCTTLSGWVLDSVNTSRVVTVQFYADGFVGVGKKIGSVTPNVLRDDINDTFKITGNHGFSWTIPAGTFAPGSSHKVYAYVLENTDQLLSGSPLAFTCAGSTGQGKTTTTFQGGSADANPTFVISSPTNGDTIVGRSVTVSYYTTVEILSTDYAVLQLDSQAPVSINYSTGGTYQFSNVLPGPHTIRGYLARADGTKIPNTSTVTTFTTQ